jgi:hypothetical protein
MVFLQSNASQSRSTVAPPTNVRVCSNAVWYKLRGYSIDGFYLLDVYPLAGYPLYGTRFACAFAA